MQEDSFSQNENSRDESVPSRVVRLRQRRRRTRYLVAGAAALVGLGLTGVTVIATGSDDSPAPTTVALDTEERAAAAARADRADRPPVTPSATATTPTPAPTSASPSPSTTPKPRASTTQKATAAPKSTRTTAAKPKASWVNPMPNAPVTSCYGQRWGTLHAGIDLALPSGTPVRAAAAGTVVKAGDVGDGYGISIFVDHGNGYLTQYAHLSATVVSVGAKVSAGTTIGKEGSTGDSTGPHLHFEVHQGMWNQIDPAPFMRARGVDLGC
ncbi:Murein DD-endopeptidase MepM and murein hydrolase activator NlpD, contain LysM domain [Micromonospora pallida]|uniref:Murein DD-endopeptidase MepM and murein hydrolase activator NlpD, contain LysM domain n=1 Tax=Micromonospora pallida TaxID=145854 RepID=A0A1C6TGW2_9ACTN|nr:M23 family metallopeptidase [Micromonospora pallida]SCL40991.1 Murein DD-endopeptidase MepM and murein hydrolase activator NlpD, contain LysM domain [Micromonospora pallida]